MSSNSDNPVWLTIGFGNIAKPDLKTGFDRKTGCAIWDIRHIGFDNVVRTDLGSAFGNIAGSALSAMIPVKKAFGSP